jgi:nucleotide-binding universal stress UspA family protein
MKTILVPVESNDTIESTLQTARLLAGIFGSYVEGFALSPTLSPFLAPDAIGGGVVYESDLAPDAAAISEARAAFERVLTADGAGTGGEGFTSAWSAEGARDDGFMGAYSRVFDVTVLGRPGSTAASPRMSTLEAALFEGGRAVLIAPPVPPRSLGEVITIAWNRSAETARTIAFAMPLLKRARRIVLLAVEGGSVAGPGGEQVARYLELHGLTCDLVHIKRESGVSFGPAILDHAARNGSDLLIKGAFTQGRISQMIFGGASRHILAEATLPVLMAH